LDTHKVTTSPVTERKRDSGPETLCTSKTLNEMEGAQGGLKGTWRLFNIEVKALDDPGKDSAAVSPALLKVRQESMSLKYEPASEPLRISVEW